MSLSIQIFIGEIGQHPHLKISATKHTNAEAKTVMKEPLPPKELDDDSSKFGISTKRGLEFIVSRLLDTLLCPRGRVNRKNIWGIRMI